MKVLILTLLPKPQIFFRDFFLKHWSMLNSARFVLSNEILAQGDVLLQ